MSIAEPMARARTTSADRVADDCIGCKLNFRGIGLQRAFDDDQKRMIAERFETTADEITGGHKLFKKGDLTGVNSARGKIVDLWKSHTLPYYLPGTRLLIVTMADDFQSQLVSLRENFTAEVNSLQRKLPEILERRKLELGTVFNRNHYPVDVRDDFAVMVSYPDLRAPDYLRQINPEAYQEELARFRERMQHAVEIAEADFALQLQDTVQSVVEALNGVKTGDRKCFRDSTINKLFETIDDFSSRLEPFHIGRNRPLEGFMDTLRSTIEMYDEDNLAGVLRNSKSKRDLMLEQFSALQESLKGASDQYVEQRRRVIM